KERLCMSFPITERNKTITELLNGTLLSMKKVIPVDYQTKNPQLVKEDLRMEFGVIIGITGDLKGKLVISGSPVTFRAIGEEMFHMPLKGEMLSSFSGEFGNMVAGGLSTNIAEYGTNVN